MKIIDTNIILSYNTVMITRIEMNNAFIYQNNAIFSMKADMRTKILADNVAQTGAGKVLKTACVFGANNVGKTCLIKCVRAIWGIIMKQPCQMSANLFSGSKKVSLAVNFIEQEEEWRFAFKLDMATKTYVYEEFSQIKRDSYGNESLDTYYRRDYEKGNFFCKDTGVIHILLALSNSDILIHTVNTEAFPSLKKASDILFAFASRIVIVDMNNIPVEKTILMLKTHSRLEGKVRKFIKLADLDLDDIFYSDKMKIKVLPQNHAEYLPAETILQAQNLEDMLRLTSVYKGREVQSFKFDSTGTKKIVALASFVVEAMKKNHILFIDELDSSLHFKLTRAIVELFNSEHNKGAQLIFTLHDVSLLDCKKLFRKEQIWFVEKDNEGARIFPLSVFTASKGVRGDTSDITEKYRQGLLCSLPNPRFIDYLLESDDSEYDNTKEKKGKGGKTQ